MVELPFVFIGNPKMPLSCYSYRGSVKISQNDKSYILKTEVCTLVIAPDSKEYERLTQILGNAKEIKQFKKEMILMYASLEIKLQYLDNEYLKGRREGRADLKKEIRKLIGFE